MPPTRKKNSKPILKRGFVSDKLYAELKKHVSTAPAHQAITSERKLAEQYDISFMTARKIVDRLVREKLLYRVHGKGTFIAEKSISNSPHKKTILYIEDWAQTDHPYPARKVQGILDEAEANGFRVQLHTCPDFMKFTNDMPFLNEVQRKDVVGILVPALTNTFYDELKRRNKQIRIVTINSASPKKDVAYIQNNFFQVGYQSTQFLQKRGARSIMAFYKQQEMLKGVEVAVRESKSASIDLHPVEWKKKDDIQLICEKILKIKPQGIFFSEDRLALSIFELLEEKDPKYLNSTTMISLANIGENILPPTMARMNIDGYEMGVVSISVLKSMVEGKTTDPTVIRIDPRLVEPSQ